MGNFYWRLQQSLSVSPKFFYPFPVMYTTQEFDRDVAELRRLIKMCDELIQKQDKNTEHLINQFNGGK